MVSVAQSVQTTDETYDVRLYEPRDREDLLALWDDVLGKEPGAWFDWKFRDNPYLDEVPICVTEYDGEVVGARPSFPLPLRVGDDSLLALVQEGAMVHADHRRRGLFTRMVEHLYDHYADREPAASIGFPNDRVVSALRNLDSRLSLSGGVVDRLPIYYRVQDPAAMTGDGDRPGWLARLAGPAVRPYLAVRDATAPGADDVRIERRPGVPAATLASLAGEHAPAAAHAARDERFYRWRFAHPRFEYATYVARRDGRPVAAVVAGRERDATPPVVHVSEALPPTGERPDALSALLGELVADSADAALVAAAGPRLPDRVLLAHGFLPDTRAPLSAVTTPDNFVARPLTSDDVATWNRDGVRLSNRDGWTLSFCERELG